MLYLTFSLYFMIYLGIWDCTVKNEMKCSGDYEILHKIVRVTTRKSEKHELICVGFATISCSISEFPLLFISFLTVYLWESAKIPSISIELQVLQYYRYWSATGTGVLQFWSTTGTGVLQVLQCNPGLSAIQYTFCIQCIEIFILRDL